MCNVDVRVDLSTNAKRQGHDDLQATEEVPKRVRFHSPLLSRTWPLKLYDLSFDAVSLPVERD